MSTAQLSLWVLATTVGFTFFVKRNPTVVALLLAFAASEAGLPLEYYPWSDVVVIAIIMTKFERSLADRFVILAYPLAWCSYVFDEPLSNPQWWHLAIIFVAQSAVVGLEPLFPYLRRRYAEATTSSTSHGLMLAYPGGEPSG